MNSYTTTASKTKCFHCGDDCIEQLSLDEKTFCCQGCMSVFQILSSNNLGSYYRLNDRPGVSLKQEKKSFDYLDDPKIIADLVNFSNTEYSIVTLYIPAIHCSSCIWLLENLYKIEPNILYSRVDFLKKQVTIRFSNHEFSLRKTAETLCKLGYEPLISLQDVIKEQKNFKNSDLIKKIAVAGFCFGNSMLWSFPEYFGMAAFEHNFKQLFGYLNLIAGTGVFFYSGWGYFGAAYRNLKNKNISIDIPLALGIFVLYARSIVEVVNGSGAGFSDTLCGLVFFLLIGKWVQQKTYFHLSFERDYRSYFPIAVTIIEDGKETPKPLSDLSVGERILVRNEEIIPADAILLKGNAKIDFSFVTGESEPESKVLGEMIYAGGRQKGEAIELEIIKPVSQSYLTRLWNNEAFEKNEKDQYQTFSMTVSKYFTLALISVALAAFGYWALNQNMERAWASFTAVLIIACPCALAISTPFTMSMALNIFDKNKFYLKNTDVVEQLAEIDSIIFDKTGTITTPNSGKLEFIGAITDAQQILIASTVKHSSHPLSKRIYQSLHTNNEESVDSFEEISGNGIVATIGQNEIKVGKLSFVLPANKDTENKKGRTEVHISINNQYLGAYIFDQQYRPRLGEVVSKLQANHQIHLLSGDKDHERSTLKVIFGEKTPSHFSQTPLDKLEYVRALQDKNHKVMMIGDGLNDAGALKQSDLGIAITENINNFTPGSDAILDAASFGKLPLFKTFANNALTVVHGSFVIAMIYNIIGLSYAVKGDLSPLIAAILMPISTVTIISFTSGATWLFGKKLGLTNSKKTL